MSQSFRCQDCGQEFSLPQKTLDRYPGWTPRRCLKCKDKAGGKKASAKKAKGPKRSKSASASQNLSLAEVLARFHDGPDTGLFTDGSAQPNPGPGGWGVVLVRDGQVIAEKHGHEAHTTNNRMELMALIEAFKLAPDDEELACYTDSDLCVKSMTQWAAGWKRNGWKRKSGPIKNLELVQELYALVQAKPNVKLQWIQAHDGSRWNEYADSLSTAWAREEL